MQDTEQPTRELIFLSSFFYLQYKGGNTGIASQLFGFVLTLVLVLFIAAKVLLATDKIHS